MKVGLVAMPWGLSDRPSIQCGLLKSTLTREGHEVDVHYLNLSLAATLGADLYRALTSMGNERQFMLGEWMFAAAAFPDAPKADNYLAALPAVEEFCSSFGLTFDDLGRLRARAIPQWLQSVMSAVSWEAYDLVGFTSTFEQQVAVLAAARLLKQVAPQVPVVVGGANVDGEMGPEYLRCFHDLDYVVVGEADESFPQMVADLSHGGTADGIPGVYRRDADGTVQGRPAEPVRLMDSLPVPDYCDYFDTLHRYGAKRVLGDRPVRVPAEFSRGCWWGAKHHCTFCGLNALGMDFRAKSPARAVAEVLEFVSSLRVLEIEAVDNIIDMRYLKEFCDELAGTDYDLSLFFEIKANMSSAQVGALRRAGVKGVQPGIESLSSRVLKIMDKGTDMLTNIRLLKAARQHDVSAVWNLLTGFPGETEADYLEQAELLPLLHHLQPPTGSGQLRLDRFSPYFDRPPPTFHDIAPFLAYTLVYPAGDLDIQKIAYYFSHTNAEPVSEKAQHALQQAVERWHESWRQRRRPRLFYARGPGFIQVTDERGQTCTRQRFDGWRASAFLGCGDSPRTPAALARELAAASPDDAPAGAEVEAFLDWCIEERLAVTENGRYLTLAVLDSGVP